MISFAVSCGISGTCEGQNREQVGIDDNGAVVAAAYALKFCKFAEVTP
jgi:hypothetical protein